MIQINLRGLEVDADLLDRISRKIGYFFTVQGKKPPPLTIGRSPEAPLETGAFEIEVILLPQDFRSGGVAVGFTDEDIFMNAEEGYLEWCAAHGIAPIHCHLKGNYVDWIS